MGLIQRIRFIVDEAAKQELAKQGKDAGERLADGVKSGESRIMGFLKGVAAGIAAAFAFEKVVEFGKKCIEAATEAEGAMDRLEFSLGKVGIRMKDVRGDVDALGKEFLDKTTFGDEAAFESLATLTQMTGNYTKSLEGTRVAADLAAAKHLSLETATMLVGRAMNGSTQLLERYGITVQKGSDALEEMRKQFGGAAEKEVNTFGGKMKQVSNYFGEFREAVGAAMIAAGGGTSILDTLTGVLKGMAEWVTKNKDEIVFFGQTGIWLVSNVLKLMWNAFRSVAQVVDEDFNRAMNVARRIIVEFLEPIPMFLRGLAAIAGALPGEQSRKDAEGLRAKADAVEQYAAKAKTMAAQELATAEALKKSREERERGLKLFANAPVRGVSPETDTGALGGNTGEHTSRERATAAAKALAEQEKEAALNAKELAAEAKRVGEAMEQAAKNSQELQERLRQSLDEFIESQYEVTKAIDDLHKSENAPVETDEEFFEHLKDNMKEAQQKAEQMAENIRRSVAGGLQLGEAIGLVSKDMADIVNSAVGFATSTSTLVSMLNKNSQAKAAGTASPFGTLAIAGGFLAAAGPLVSLASSLFGESPAHREMMTNLKANTTALLALPDKLLSLNVSGQQRQQAQAVLSNFNLTGGLTGDRFAESAFGDAAGRYTRSLTQIAERMGMTFEQLQAAAKEMGITLDGSRKSIDAFNHALGIGAITKFGDTFDDQMSKINQQIELFDITDPVKKLELLRDVMSDPKFGAPALRQALAGLDLTTPEGRAAADKAIQQLFTRLDTGGIKSAGLGGMTPEQFREALNQLHGTIKDAADVVDNVVDPNRAQFAAISQTVTEVTAMRLDAGIGTISFWLSSYLPRIAVATEMMAGITPGTPGTGRIQINISAGAGTTQEMIDAVRTGMGQALQSRQLAYGNVVME